MDSLGLRECRLCRLVLVPGKIQSWTVWRSGHYGPAVRLSVLGRRQVVPRAPAPEDVSAYLCPLVHDSRENQTRMIVAVLA